MKQVDTPVNDLQALNSLLKKERAAILRLQLKRLNLIQQDKIRLLTKLKLHTRPPDRESRKLIRKIRSNTGRNRYLLASGLALFTKMQQDLRGRMGITYGHGGQSLPSVPAPRLVKRSA